MRHDALMSSGGQCRNHNLIGLGRRDLNPQNLRESRYKSRWHLSNKVGRNKRFRSILLKISHSEDRFLPRVIEVLFLMALLKCRYQYLTTMRS